MNTPVYKTPEDALKATDEFYFSQEGFHNTLKKKSRVGYETM